MFGVFRVKNHDFYAKKIIFLPILGGRAPGAPPLDPPLHYTTDAAIIDQKCSDILHLSLE
jgi:hypothetical protein